jgi:hypothetical protein
VGDTIHKHRVLMGRLDYAFKYVSVTFNARLPDRSLIKPTNTGYWSTIGLEIALRRCIAVAAPLELGRTVTAEDLLTR